MRVSRLGSVRFVSLLSLTLAAFAVAGVAEAAAPQHADALTAKSSAVHRYSGASFSAAVEAARQRQLDTAITEDTRSGDMRLASLDPSSIVYERRSDTGSLGRSASMAAYGLSDRDSLIRSDAAMFPPVTEGSTDFVLMAFVAVMLIAYQLRRKHRFLRPHRFGR